MGGRIGGKSRSKAKLAAVKRNLKKAQAARHKKAKRTCCSVGFGAGSGGAVGSYPEDCPLEQDSIGVIDPIDRSPNVSPP
jgi:O-acetyl-ADP-ribose deacetylase (regulator of RNase III)